jgi:phosphate transport system substrate-binding protein
MVRGRFAIVALCLAIALFSAPPRASARGASLEDFKGMSGTINIAGGTAHIPVMEEAAQRIMRAHPDIRITVAGGGSGVGVQKVGEGLVDIGNTGRPLSEAEQEKYGLHSYAFAIDGVCVAVHPSNPVDDLTPEQVQGIFAGRIAQWSELGPHEGDINLYTRDEASGTRAVFWKKLLSKGKIAGGANVVPSNGAMKVAISRDKRGIGYLSMGHVDESIKPVSLDGVAPTQQNAVSGEYTVVRKLYMNTKGDPSPLTKTFIRYIKGAECADIIRNKGFIPMVPSQER